MENLKETHETDFQLEKLSENDLDKIAGGFWGKFDGGFKDRGDGAKGTSPDRGGGKNK